MTNPIYEEEFKDFRWKNASSHVSVSFRKAFKGGQNHSVQSKGEAHAHCTYIIAHGYIFQGGGGGGGGSKDSC